MSRFSLGAAGALTLVMACQYDPEPPVLHYSLSEDTLALDEYGRPIVPGKVREHILGSLEMLFGSPAHPQYMLLAEWADAGFDPNYPQFPADDMGSGELDGEWDAIVADNTRRFAEQLAHIDAGEYESVKTPRGAPDLRAEWADLLATQADFEQAEEFRGEARRLFEEYYPTLRDSSELYRTQCLHCHGTEGGGNGPTADFLDPRPRDYRLGVFKFTALKDKANPRREDLYRILSQGVTGTAMPSFMRFSRSELHGLVDYVRLLSIRGMVERDLRVTYENEDPLTPEYVAESYKSIWERWQRASESVIAYDGEVPAPTPEGIARGRELFMDAGKGNCQSCHGASGRGNGDSAFVTDEHGDRMAKPDDWGNSIMPRNLRLGINRGGSRPIDIYRRIYAGINGTQMPALGESKDADGNPLLTPEELWNIVHYVRSLGERPPPVHVASSGHSASSEPRSSSGHSEGSGSGH